MTMDLISVHVPKTAGTSFGRVLERVYGPGRVFRHYDGVVDPAVELIDQIRPGHRVVHGHFPVESYEGHFPEAPRIAWIRHPVSWIVSYYHFLPTLPPNDHPAWVFQRRERPSLLEFASHESVQETTQATLLGRGDLGEFAFVGLQEHFAEDLRDVSRLLGWPGVAPPSENRNGTDEYRRTLAEVRGDPRLASRILERLEADSLLYEAASRLRAARRRRRGAVPVA